MRSYICVQIFLSAMTSSCTFLFPTIRLILLTLLFAQIHKAQYPHVCDPEDAPHFDHALFVNWSSHEAHVLCTDNYVYVGKHPAVTCEAGTWRTHGTCRRYLWKSPDFKSIYTLPMVLRPGHEICFPAKRGETKWPIISFENSKHVLFRIQMRPDERKIVGNPFMHYAWGRQDEFVLPLLLKAESVVFVQVKAISDRELQVVFNGIHTYTYNSGHRVEDIKYFKTSLTVLDIDLVCHQHKVNFCKEHFAPSLENGHIVFVPTTHRLEGSATCRDGFYLSNLATHTHSHCDFTGGWIISDECRILLLGEKTGDGYSLSSVMTPQYELCFSAITGSELWPSLSFRTGPDILYLFQVQSTLKVVIANSYVLDKWGQEQRFPAEWELAPNATVFVKVTTLSDQELQVVFNGIHTYTYTSGYRVQDIQYFKTSLTVLEIDFACKLHKVNFCKEGLAPSLANGQMTWKKTGDIFLGLATCNEGFVRTNIHNIQSHCTVTRGWEVGEQCRKEPPRQNVEDGYSIRETVTPGYQICISAKAENEKWPVLSFSNEQDILFSFEIRPDEKKLVANSFVRDSWGQPTEFPLSFEITGSTVIFIKVNATSNQELTVVVNGVYNYTYRSQHRVQDITKFTTTLTIFKIDLACNKHRISFCREDLAPTLANGSIAWIEKDGKLVGNTTCNEGFVVRDVPSVHSQCDVTGWVVSEVCSAARHQQQPKDIYRLPVAVAPGREICISAKVEADDRPTLSFTNGYDTIFSFEIRLDEKNIFANSFVKGAWGQPRRFPLSFVLKPNTIVFVKIKAVSDTDMQFSFNGIHTYDYSLGYSVHDIFLLETTLTILEVDIECEYHKVNFCRKDLAPSLPDGDIKWNKTGDSFIGTATCNEGFSMSNTENTQTQCDVTSGWVISEACSPGNLQQTFGNGYRIPAVVAPGHQICLSGRARAEEKWPSLSLQYGHDILFSLEIRADENKLVAKPFVQNTWGHPTEFFLSFLMKTDTVVFVKVTALDDNNLQVVFNGVHSYVVTSGHPLKDILYFKTSLTVLKIDLMCHAPKSSFCRENFAPSFYNGVLTWISKGGSLEGRSSCNLGFYWSPLANTSSHCDDKDGWILSEECRILLPGEQPGNGYSLPSVMTPGYEICFSAIAGSEKWPSLSFRNGPNIIFLLTVRTPLKNVAGNSFVGGIWGRELNFSATWILAPNPTFYIKVKALTDKEIQVVFNGVHSYSYSSGYQIQDIQYFKTSFTVLEIDLACTQHKVNFCKENLAPSLADGAFEWRRTGDRLDGRATCNHGFVLTNDYDVVRAHCSVQAGWTMSAECLSKGVTRTYKHEYRLPVALRLDYAIWFSANTGTETRHNLTFSTWWSDVLVFEVDLINKKIVSKSFVLGKWGQHAEFRLTNTLKQNTIVFVAVTPGYNLLQVMFNGFHIYNYHSGYPLQDIQYFKTSLIVLEIDLDPTARKVDFCKKKLSPSFFNGVLSWRKTKNNVKAVASCNQGFFLSSLEYLYTHCDSMTAWTMSDECFPLKHGQRPGKKYFVAEIQVTAGYEICFTGIKGGGDRYDVYFGKGEEAPYLFRIDTSERSVTAMRIVNKHETRKKVFPLPMVITRNARVFVKVKALSNIEMQLVINGIHTFSYYSEQRVQEIQYFETTFTILEIDLTCKHHTVNFCVEDLSPTLSNGYVTWEKNNGRLEGTAKCNNGFYMSTLSNSHNNCDPMTGWTVSVECRILLPGERPGDEYPIPYGMEPGHEICLTGVAGLEERPSLSFRNGPNILFSFEIQTKPTHSCIYMNAFTEDKWETASYSLSSWRLKPNGTVFIKFTAVREDDLKVEFNGIHLYDHYNTHYVSDIRYFKTSFTVLEIDLSCHLHKTNFCRENLAPSIADGAAVWRKTPDGFEGSVTCNNGFVLDNNANGRNYCNLSHGWVVSKECRLYGSSFNSSAC